MPIYKGEGFNIYNFNQPLKKGNLLLKFDIEFPKKLSN